MDSLILVQSNSKAPDSFPVVVSDPSGNSPNGGFAELLEAMNLFESKVLRKLEFPSGV